MTDQNINQIIDQYNTKEIDCCPFPTGILKIDLNKLESNILNLTKSVNKQKEKNIKFLFPIKANAYGHGMIPLAKFIEYKNLCSYFGVAHLQEAQSLKENGITTPILILGQSFYEREHFECIVKNDIEQSVSDEKILHSLDATAKKFDKITSIHLSIDTGMGRCGVLFENMSNFLDKISDCRNIRLAGVMTHFAVSDENSAENIEYTEKQIKLFAKAKDIVMEKFPNENIIFHASNSGGVLNHPLGIFDMIRPGIATYGYPEQNMGLGLQPIMEVKTKVSLIKIYPKDYSIGYGCTYKTRSDDEHIAIIPIGYGDGLSRSLGNKLTPIINGKKAKSVGRISMDQLSVGVDENTKVDDEVIIIGEHNGISNTAHDIALQSDTIAYEVLCNLGNSRRMRHEYIYNDKKLLQK